MSRRKALAFLAIAFAISWTAITLSWLGGARSIQQAREANGFFMIGPPVAALVCSLLFDKGQRIRSLGLSLRPNRWWAAAVLTMVAYVSYVTAASNLFGWTNTQLSPDPRQSAASVFRIPIESIPAGPAGMIAVFAAAVLIFTIQSTLTEELGWRGYLYRQWRHLGFWHYSLATGLVWGVWHWPMVWYFGLDFGDNRMAGLAYYPLALMGLAPMMTLLRDRGGSIWAPGIYHGTSNAVGIILFGELEHQSAPVFAQLLLFLPVWALIEWFRRKWPAEPVL